MRVIDEESAGRGNNVFVLMLNFFNLVEEENVKTPKNENSELTVLEEALIILRHLLCILPKASAKRLAGLEVELMHQVRSHNQKNK